MNITFLVAENCLSSGITGIIDTLTIANLWQMELTGTDLPLFETELVSIDGKPVAGSGNVQFNPGKSIADSVDEQYIVLPPFVPLPSLQSAEYEHIKEWIITKHKETIPIAALCTGTFLLAETGLLNRKEATTNWHFARKFKRRYPQIKLKPEELITEDQGLICTGAATAIYNFALSLIEKYGSKKLATICSKALLIDPNRMSQSPYIIDYNHCNHNDTTIAKAQYFMEKNYGTINSVNEVANHVCLSSRHFKRRFKEATSKSPLSYLQDLRITLAKKKLESTLDSIDDITLYIGYENSSTFRRLFKNRTSLTPREYRDKFYHNKV